MFLLGTYITYPVVTDFLHPETVRLLPTRIVSATFDILLQPNCNQSCEKKCLLRVEPALPI